MKQIRHDIELFRSQHPRTRIADAWLEHPRREVRRLADTVEAFWERAIEPAWPRIRAFLDADIAHRARRLAQGGPAALFADLHPGVAWADDHLDVTSDRNAAIALEGRGLVMMPSAFQWARPATTDLEPWQPTLIYPARGIATLWERGRARARRPRPAARRHPRRGPRRPRRAAVDDRPRTAAVDQPRGRLAPPHHAARRRAGHRAPRGPDRPLRPDPHRRRAGRRLTAGAIS